MEGKGGGTIIASAARPPSLLHLVATVCRLHLLATAHTEPLSHGWSSSSLITCEGISQGLWHWCQLVWCWDTDPQNGGFHRCCYGQREGKTKLIYTKVNTEVTSEQGIRTRLGEVKDLKKPEKVQPERGMTKLWSTQGSASRAVCYFRPHISSP